jgi:hypothetical protein
MGYGIWAMGYGTAEVMPISHIPFPISPLVAT